MARKTEILTLKEIVARLWESGVKLKTEIMYKNSEYITLICSCGEEYVSNLTQVLYDNRIKCKKCTSRMMKDEDFKKILYDLRKDDYIALEKYNGNNVNILVKHNIDSCGYEYKVTPYNLVGAKQQCPKCQNKIPKTFELIKEELIKIGKSDEYTLIGLDNKTERRMVNLIHNKCGHEFEASYSNFFKNNGRCPICFGYKNEVKVFEILKSNNINFKKQYWFDDCRYKNPLPFDFAIFDNNDNLKFILEIDGEGHYKVTRFKGMTLEKATKLYEDTKRNDEIKNKYCKNNNISLVRIPYTESENIEQILLELILDIV